VRNSSGEEFGDQCVQYVGWTVKRRERGEGMYLGRRFLAHDFFFWIYVLLLLKKKGKIILPTDVYFQWIFNLKPTFSLASFSLHWFWTLDIHGLAIITVTADMFSSVN